MNKRIKKKWIAALRSGAYVRGEEQLVNVSQDDDGVDVHTFCCLGVLENIMHEEKNTTFHRHNYSDGFHGVLCALWSGLPTCDADNDKGLSEKLAEFNDSGQSFKKIARWIERSKQL